MPDRSRDLIRYTTYFNMSVPSSLKQTIIFIFLGIVTGIISILITHYGNYSDISKTLIYGAGSGILILSLPALLTAIILKIMKRKLKIRHALFAVLVISLTYSGFILGASVVYTFLHSRGIAYVMLLLSNAGIYGYWFFINKVAVGQKKSAILTASIQPILNIFFYLLVGRYLFDFSVPLTSTILKLYSGMFVFLGVGYLSLYIIERPGKRDLEISSVALFTSMVGQLLYDFTKDTKILGSGGIKRDVSIDVLILKGRRRYKAVFIKPDLHYGPFANIGGSVLTEQIGREITNNYKSIPFIVHGAVNIDDNPISTIQVSNMAKHVIKYIDSINPDRFRDCKGSISYGKDKHCRAINISLNNINLLTLTKAPKVTEDIEREIGVHFENIADGREGSKTILLDAHNSRFESAPKDELKGIYEGSRYVSMYEKAIQKAVRFNPRKQIRFGGSTRRLSVLIKGKKDLGNGYTSIGIFEAGKRYCMIYFDANNMLPNFRNDLVSHVNEKFGLDVELYTTDTHSVNSLAFGASNCLGRDTSSKDVLPIIDDMIEEALQNMEPVKMVYGSTVIEDFKTWGSGSEDAITKVGMDIISMSKRIIPFIVVIGFIIAAWIIYVV